MSNQYDIDALSKKISELRRISEDLLQSGGEIETVKRNVKRILANIKMLELNISDVAEIGHS